MAQSKYFLLDRNLLAEWVYEDATELVAEDQVIIEHKLPEWKSFANTDFKPGNIPSATGNILSRQLTPFNLESNIWTPVDVNNPRLVVQTYPYPAPVKYDTLKIHLPISYNFEDVVGIALNVYTFNKDMNKEVHLSTWYYDKTVHNSPDIEEPFVMSEKYWGKYFQIRVPSVASISSDIVANGPTFLPREGSLNSRLDDSGLSQSAPIFITVTYIRRRRQVGNIFVYEMSSELEAATSQGEEYLDLGLLVEESSEGHWINISGVYNNQIAGFGNFLNMRLNSGAVDTVEYEINLIEAGTRTSSDKRYLDSEVGSVIEYRPIIKNTSTTAMIEVIMRLTNQVDNSVIERKGALTLTGSQISRYGRYMSRIDVSGALKPIVYVNKESGSTMKIDGGLNLNATTKYFPILIERKSIVLKDRSSVVDGETFFAQGQGELVIYPYDNVFRLIVANQIDSNTVQYFSVPPDSQPKLLFKSNDTLVELNLWTDSGEVDLANGSMVFRLNPEEVRRVSKIYYSGFPFFYIVLDTGVSRSVLYSGNMILFESPEYRARIQ